MFLSIVIPIWNDEKFLNECLDSCLNQRLSKDEYEIICVDDGSTDQTPNILKLYMEQYPNIRVITKQHGPQFGNGRNIGFNVARGEYIWFVDHDDLIAPHAVDILGTATKENKEFDRISFPYYEFFGSLTETEKSRFQDGTLRANAGESLVSATLWSGIIKVSFMREHQIYPRPMKVEEAETFWGTGPLKVWGTDNICMEECFDCGMRTKHLNCPPLYFYRRHENSETMSQDQKVLQMKAIRKFDTILVRLYDAIQWKQKYLAERDQYGLASAKTTGMMMWKIRHPMLVIAGMPRNSWKAAIALVKEKDLLFQKKPPEYTTGLWEYMKSRTLREKLSPTSYVIYYLYHPTGVRTLRLMQLYRRIAVSIPLFTNVYRWLKKRKERRN